MAVLLDQITIGQSKILILDSAPDTGAGYSVGVGSIAIIEGQSGIYQKTGALDTDWTISSVNSEDVQDIVGALFTDTSDIDFNYDDTGNNATVSLSPTGVSASTYGSATAVSSFTVDSKGRISSASNTTIAIPSSQVTDFTEAAQDAVGTALTDSATVDFTYNDAGNTISASVIQSGIDHGSVSGLSDDDHAQYALLAGRSGGQSLTGGTASSNDLTLSSTTNATKGKINLGSSSAFDEANTRLGVGTASPESILQLDQNNVKFNIIENSTSTTGAVNAVVASITTANNSVELLKVYVTGFNSANNNSVAYERTAKVKNNAGTVSLGVVQSDYTDEDPSLNAANCTFIVTGSAIDVRVTGVTGTTLTWKAVVQRVR